jgi:hypothetical protein
VLCGVTGLGGRFTVNRLITATTSFCLQNSLLGDAVCPPDRWGVGLNTQKCSVSELCWCLCIHHGYLLHVCGSVQLGNMYVLFKSN